jgi:hypothetical protein
VEQKATRGAHDAKTAIDSWLTAKTKIAVFGDDRITGGLVSVEARYRCAARWIRARPQPRRHRSRRRWTRVKSVRNGLQMVPPGDRAVIDTSDKDMTRQVEGRLSKDAPLKTVDVRTDGGAVILTGSVASLGASARASELARKVPGVPRVKSELTYDPARRDGARATHD